MENILTIFLIIIGAISVYYMIFRIILRGRLFGPDYNWCTPAQANAPEFTESTVPTRDGQMRTIWHAAGNKNKPVVLYLHGNFFSNAAYSFMMKPYTDAGFSVCMAEYRGFDKTGGHASERGFYLDARAAYDFLIKAGYKKIVIHGNSLGASVAAKIASDLEGEGTPPFGVILEAPFYNLLAMCPKLPLIKLFAGRMFRSDKYVQNIKSPHVLLMHGAMDKLICPRQGTGLFGKIAAPKKLLKIFTGGAHELVDAGSVEYATTWLKKLK